MLLFGLVIFCLVADVCSQACSGARCGDCLITDGCGWCKDSVFSFPRCAPINQLTDNGCIAVIKRKEHVVQLLKNDEFSDGGPGLEPVQIKPQRIKIRLTPNSQLNNVMVFYKIAKNFPLDLYFLNDPSYTMRQLTSSLNLLANDIANDIAKLTTDFTFGLGTSMDKVVSPFTRQDPKFLAVPCGTTSIACDFPYSFIHRQSLTNDITAFTNAVRSVNTTGNQDIVEGLLDGLMQVMVCGDRIGWRKKARRMVIYATDINFHHAGDGRVAGILQPNDGLCHLDSNGKYTMAEIQDYPSVGQILQKARDNNINIIFVIGGAENEFIRNNYYDKFATYLPGGFNNASELTTDASNILNIVGSSYRRLRETVKLVMTKVPEELDVGIYSNCRTGRILDKTNNCTGLTLEKWTNFTLFLFSNMTTCPDQRTVNFTIFPEGLEERVEIEVEHVCDCDCQLEPEAEPNSTKCNQRGTYECGVCHCNEGWSGDSCECDERGSETEACGTETGICSNAGNCTCRKCDCFEGFSGDKCECNDLNCPSFNGKLCGGPSNGRCSCGSCVCDPAYSGKACDCMTSTEACRDSNGTLCSDNGNCVCGKCECNAGFSGAVCERCQSCPGTCSTNNDCVECVGFNQGKYNQSVCLSKCGNVEAVAVFLEPGNETTTTSCILQDSFGCIIYYNVYETDTGRIVQVRSVKRCPPGPADPVTVGLSVSGAFFLVGIILLLIWKLLTMLYDKLEYAHFESEIKNPVWEKSENPIYKECVTTVQNPMHDMADVSHDEIANEASHI